MGTGDWHECMFLESTENLKPLVKMRFGREPSTTVARDIVACLQQGRLFYEAASSSPLEIRPLQQFYGMVGFSKALKIARSCRRVSTLPSKHGLRDISEGGCKIADLRVKLEDVGTFQGFNDVVAELARVQYIDHSTNSRSLVVPSTTSNRLHDLELSLREILSRIPHIESTYRMTFREDSCVGRIDLQPALGDEKCFRIRIDLPEQFNDRETLKMLVTRFRVRFPFLNIWSLHSAELAWGNSVILFRNTRNSEKDEFSDTRLLPHAGGFLRVDLPGDDISPFTLEEGFHPMAGSFSSGLYAISPVGGCYLSEFSFHYLALFLLGSLVRYRPETWTHAISHSVMPDAPADDQTLSLIWRFLNLNSQLIPGMVVRVLNPYEDE
jgi:hypothetical protein